MLPQPSQRSDRINVRVGDEALQQLDEMVSATGASVSEIVRASLSAEYARFRAEAARSKPSAIVANAGKFRSSGAGAGSLSTDYKKLLAQGFGTKRSHAAR
jgi:Arc/MetJ-type ribon-helix-helix transcriptional regulator